MEKQKLLFYLDYGTCFWGADENTRHYHWPNELPVSPEAQRQVEQFVAEYHQYYGWGCPPSEGWTVEDCKRFNREYKRILDLVIPELGENFIVCVDQLDLIEDEEVLAEFYRRPLEFREERKRNYYGYDDLA